MFGWSLGIEHKQGSVGQRASPPCHSWARPAHPAQLSFLCFSWRPLNQDTSFFFPWEAFSYEINKMLKYKQLNNMFTTEHQHFCKQCKVSVQALCWVISFLWLLTFNQSVQNKVTSWVSSYSNLYWLKKRKNRKDRGFCLGKKQGTFQYPAETL